MESQIPSCSLRLDLVVFAAVAPEVARTFRRPQCEAQPPLFMLPHGFMPSRTIHTSALSIETPHDAFRLLLSTGCICSLCKVLSVLSPGFGTLYSLGTLNSWNPNLRSLPLYFASEPKRHPAPSGDCSLRHPFARDDDVS